jgi:hypothetical protein
MICAPVVVREIREFVEKLERAAGIEPTSEAWKASVLPLNYARSAGKHQKVYPRTHKPQKTRCPFVAEWQFG